MKKNCGWVNYKWVIIVDKSNVAANKVIVALKAENDKVDINKLVNVPTRLNNLKRNADSLHIGKLKTVPVDSKN